MCLNVGGYNEKINNFYDAFWLTVVTMSGVGYGDTWPVTIAGRLVVMFGVIFGGAILA